MWCWIREIEYGVICEGRFYCVDSLGFAECIDDNRQYASG